MADSFFKRSIEVPAWVAGLVAIALNVGGAVPIQKGPVEHNGRNYLVLRDSSLAEAEKQATALGGRLIPLSENDWLSRQFGVSNRIVEVPEAVLRISFSNSVHGAVRGAAIRSIDPTRIIYSSGGGSGGAVQLQDLPPDLQLKFGYDLTTVEKLEQQQNELKQRQLAAKVVQAKTAQQKATMAAQRAQVIAMRRVIYGKILQKTSLGFLMNSGEYYETGSSSGWTHAKNKALRNLEFYGDAILMAHPQERGLVDNDYIEIIAYPIGSYTYETVTGATRTIRAFTCNLDDAVTRWQTGQLEINSLKSKSKE